MPVSILAASVFEATLEAPCKNGEKSKESLRIGFLNFLKGLLVLNDSGCRTGSPFDRKKIFQCVPRKESKQAVYRIESGVPLLGSAECGPAASAPEAAACRAGVRIPEPLEKKEIKSTPTDREVPGEKKLRPTKKEAALVKRGVCLGLKRAV